ncbi:uncharacterized protein LOC113386630 [Ctenocephalides felis]|uniref:uncharacterized protein LOC113386630 n=1 Tax=Ctenocephalides felis TaxID=7515 RepID=UPI000E6E2DC8|nr:uncharacterized protein LOC113386630 [Ctenocephalides felis]
MYPYCFTNFLHNSSCFANPSTSFPSSPIPTTSFHSYALPATSIPTTSFHSYALPASPIPTTSFHSDALPASPIHMTTANSNTVSFIRQPSSPLLSQSSRSLTSFPVTPTRPRPQDNALLYSEHFTGFSRVLRITCPIQDCGNAYTRYSALQNILSVIITSILTQRQTVFFY